MVTSNRKHDIFPTKDVSKSALFIPKLILETLNLWPEKQSFTTKITFWIMLTALVLLEIGQVAYFVQNMNDIANAATALSTISTTTQAIAKMPTIYIFSDTLNEMIKVIWYKFWPSDLLDVKTKKLLQGYCLVVVTCMLSVGASAILFQVGFLGLPLISGNMKLPMESVYPFNWKSSPIYEIVYVTQWFVNAFVIVPAICGHDFLFLAISSNIVAQYVMLQRVYKQVGTSNVQRLNQKLKSLQREDCSFENSYEKDKMLLVTCIKHHNLLAEQCRKLERVFTTTAFVQLFCSMIAICVSSFLITKVDIKLGQMTSMLFYVSGHIFQLFIICAAGNELNYQITILPQYIFASKWYKINDLQNKKNIIFVLKRSMVETKLTALNVITLNYPTFIEVMRLSFSFYTLLSKITEK